MAVGCPYDAGIGGRVAYVRSRSPSKIAIFGRPVRARDDGEAIKHMLADRFVDNESAFAAVKVAAQMTEQESPDFHEFGSLCRAVASEAFYTCAGTNVQVHGGIGSTWEHDAHLYFKRAVADRQLLGAPDFHLEQLMRIAISQSGRNKQSPQKGVRP